MSRHTEDTGYDPGELLGNGWYEKTRNNFMRGREAQLEMRRRINASEGAADLSLEREILDADKERRQFMWNTSPGPEGSIMGIGTDISLKKKEQMELLQAKQEIEQRQLEIEASIRYARRLQSSFLPSEEYLRSCFHDSFIFHKSKDIVSGDFYWVYRNEEKVFLAVADCTGHGVPGAFISIVGNTLLKDIIIRQRIYNPARILNILDRELQFSLENPGKEQMVADGMDIGLIVYDYRSCKVKYAGANRPAFLVRDGEMKELRPNKFGIGYDVNAPRKNFISQTAEICPGDMLYLFSDGYTDQFGGANVKKFNRKRFGKLLVSASELQASKQKQVVEQSFESWKGSQEQIDDVTVVGVKF